MGPFVHEAEKAYLRAREKGVSEKRAMVEGNVASYRVGWAFRRNIAEHIGASVRTVQRGITQAKTEGRMGVARLKKNEVPHGAKGPLTCGGSNRWTIGWGKGNDDVKREVERARLRQLERAIAASLFVSSKPARRSLPLKSHADRSRFMPPAPVPAPAPRVSSLMAARPKPPPTPRERWHKPITAAELDAELERLERTRDGPE